MVHQRIVGGEIANPGDWPFLAELSLDGKHLCGGALISDDVLLTAGHCIERAEGRRLTVTLGDYDLTTIDEGEQLFEVADTWIHPAYGTCTGQIVDHDVGLVLLDHPAERTAFVQPISLDGCEDATDVWLSGWGSAGADLPASKIVEAARARVARRAECSAYLADLGAVDQIDEVLCVGGTDGAPGACHSDSGGPVASWTPAGRWQLQGIIVAGGARCDGFTVVANRRVLAGFIDEYANL
jgi:transmembrane serine protease 6